MTRRMSRDLDAAYLVLLCLLWALSGCAHLAPAVGDTDPGPQGCILAIPPRLQWDQNLGYCGEASIQALAMYYGSYISQYQARAMVRPDQRQDVLIGTNETIVLDNLRLTYQQWDRRRQPVPQFKAYLAWIKQQLAAGHPVIATVFYPGGEFPDYDHIVPVIGFKSFHDKTGYWDDDTLFFYDNYETSRFSRAFKTLAASRAEADAGSLSYYVPRLEDYGCAVTGISDSNHETVPIQLGVDRRDEPYVVAGEEPAVMHATLAIRPLTPGRVYSLLRYDDYNVVPKADFLAQGGYTRKQTFTAATATEALTDTFMSNQCVIYRCVADAKGG